MSQNNPASQDQSQQQAQQQAQEQAQEQASDAAGSGAEASQAESQGFFERLNGHYVDNPNAFENFAGDLGAFYNNFTDFSWLGSLFDFDLPILGGLLGGVPGLVGGVFGDGIIGFVLTLLLILALAATIVILALSVVMHTAIYIYRIFRYYLWREPGEIKLGYIVREGTTKRARLARIIFPKKIWRQSYEASTRHREFRGSTGTGKTVYMSRLIRQNLRAGLTTVVTELDGSLAEKARRYAELYKRKIIVLDPTDSGTGYWNPVAGPDKFGVAEQMVNLVASDYVTDQYFKNIATVLTRQAVIAVKSYEEESGEENTAGTTGDDANINHLMNFIADRSYRDKVLGLESSKQTGIMVTATWLPAYTSWWFQTVYFGQWTSDQRENHTSGLTNAFEIVAGNPALRQVITPPPAEGTAEALEDPHHPTRQIVIEDAIESGALVILRMPTSKVGAQSAISAAGWLAQRLQAATQSRPTTAPLSIFLDEAHLILGKENASIAQMFTHWIPVARNYGVSLNLAYQSETMIEYTLRAVFMDNLRTKLIPGGSGPDDLRAAEEIGGYRDTVVEEVRRTRRQFIPGGVLLSLGQSVTTGTKEGTESLYPAHKIEKLPLGTWMIKTLNRRKPMPAFLLRSPNPSRLHTAVETRCIQLEVIARETYTSVAGGLDRVARSLAAEPAAWWQEKKRLKRENERLRQMEEEAQQRSQGSY